MKRVVYPDLAAFGPRLELLQQNLPLAQTSIALPGANAFLIDSFSSLVALYASDATAPYPPPSDCAKAPWSLSVPS